MEWFDRASYSIRRRQMHFEGDTFALFENPNQAGERGAKQQQQQLITTIPTNSAHVSFH